MRPSTRSGRRPGDSGTRDRILETARRQFGELGYDRTTVRGIAAEAGVDPALVAHFFGSKQRLFASAVELPFDPEVVLPKLLGGDPATMGARLARFVLELQEAEDTRWRMVGVLRAAASEPEAARIVRERIIAAIFAPMVASLDVADAPLRASLVSAQVVGLLMARHVVGVEPLASIDLETIVSAVGPALQHYLTGPLHGS